MKGTNTESMKNDRFPKLKTLKLKIKQINGVLLSWYVKEDKCEVRLICILHLDKVHE